MVASVFIWLLVNGHARGHQQHGDERVMVRAIERLGRLQSAFALSSSEVSVSGVMHVELPHATP